MEETIWKHDDDTCHLSCNNQVYWFMTSPCIHCLLWGCVRRWPSRRPLPRASSQRTAGNKHTLLVRTSHRSADLSTKWCISVSSPRRAWGRTWRRDERERLCWAAQPLSTSPNWNKQEVNKKSSHIPFSFWHGRISRSECEILVNWPFKTSPLWLESMLDLHQITELCSY